MEHTKNHIRTFTGIFMDPFDIKPQEVCIADIAHALCMMVRANGHINSFYSIAQHCLNCAAEAKGRGYSAKVQLACLLHDAAECYTADVPRPVKHRLQGYALIEERVTQAVFEAFGLSDLNEAELVKVGEIDDAILYYEFEALAGIHIMNNAPYISMEHEFSQKRIEDVEMEFINTFDELYITLS